MLCIYSICKIHHIALDCRYLVNIIYSFYLHCKSLYIQLVINGVNTNCRKMRLNMRTQQKINNIRIIQCTMLHYNQMNKRTNKFRIIKCFEEMNHEYLKYFSSIRCIAESLQKMNAFDDSYRMKSNKKFNNFVSPFQLSMISFFFLKSQNKNTKKKNTTYLFMYRR